ncbi:chaperonin-containing T-complex alpha subunit Cct1 [Mitosporidium daphniae]|uniref:Subunit alpha of T-complex protein 1 n=1 Tax=Mitosporidium daphniae TaxID=1485682 RepID=A0A098VQF7_9MICR|nr:subunit alpha of T-complex protein 1 [Mitosporidium daphniae]KGG51044.1 subunit alpha of T-complex protein 1 [Mitosporidium daphniae]|eukprot:XP_013237471.1 subunit alpha of T-complex protein 1 [Mitosporidium daphniae]
MLVDELGEVTISNDGATILSMLEVEHPTARMLVEMSRLQDKEVGDGTTSVVLLAAELLRQANELIKLKIHPTTIISGFRLALRESCKFIAEKLAIPVDSLGKDTLIHVARTCLSSKILGAGGLPDEEASSFFAKMAADAIMAVRTPADGGSSKNAFKYPVNGVSILKAHGQSQLDSFLVNGYALNCVAASPAMKSSIKNARIACLDFNLQRIRLPLGVNVLVSDPDKLEDIRKREIDLTRERIQKVLASGANVVLTTRGIDDMAMKLFVEAGAIAVRRVAREDILRICKLTGATLLTTLATLEGTEAFDASALGTAESINLKTFASDECLLIETGSAVTGAASIILRGPTSIALDEMERSMHDALCVVKRTLESSSVVAGGGAVEAALSVFLESFASSIGSREQLAIAKFAESLLTIPKSLALNAGKDSTELIGRLRAFHYKNQQNPTGVSGPLLTTNSPHMGLDLIQGTVRNNAQAGVLEPTMVKLKALKAATEAAISILRIDDMIKIFPDEKKE